MRRRQAGRVGASAVVSVLVLTAVVVVVSGVLWSRGSLNALICDGDCGPSAIATPDALNRDGSPVAALPKTATGGSLDPDAIEAAVADELDSDDLGPRVGFAAVDPANGAVLGSGSIEGEGADVYVPASTTKLLTGLAVLTELDPQQRFSTRVMRDDDRLVLVGGGDPYLVTKKPRRTDYAVEADLTTLATRTATALQRVDTTTVRLDYETSMFTGPDASPTWEEAYIDQNIVTPISALMVDGGVAGGTRVDDPAKAAAETFARLLERRGIEVTDSPVETTAPSVADPVAAVRSATVVQVVEAMIARSDNEAAEVLLRHAAIEAGEPGSFDGGADAVRSVLGDLGVDTSGLELFDGSGLSRDNRISPQTLAEVVTVSARSARTDSLVSDLPVGGFTGTLTRRFSQAEPGLGVVRAKTGTLTGIHSLAGYVTDAVGTPIAFAVMTDRTRSVNPFVTQAALDRVAAALADCTCSSPVP